LANLSVALRQSPPDSSGAALILELKVLAMELILIEKPDPYPLNIRLEHGHRAASRQLLPGGGIFL
jgi:hypothetical protein